MKGGKSYGNYKSDRFSIELRHITSGGLDLTPPTVESNVDFYSHSNVFEL